MSDKKEKKTRVGFIDLGFGSNSSKAAKKENKSILDKKGFGINLGINKDIKEMEKRKKKEVKV